MNELNKEIRERKGIKLYLLGKDKSGRKYWLEEESWDCDWYWAFGYIESFTKRDSMISHLHAKDFYPKVWGEKESLLVKTTFTEIEGWTLTELFEQFYLFRDLADFLHLGHVGKVNIESIIKLFSNKRQLEKEINTVVLPHIINSIKGILTP